jgi:hypothetical protein
MHIVKRRATSSAMAHRKVEGAKVLYAYFKTKQTALGSSYITVRTSVMMNVIKRETGRLPWEAIFEFLQELESAKLIRILYNPDSDYWGYRIAVLECTPWPGLTRYT